MTSDKNVLIDAPQTDYDGDLADPDLIIHIRNEKVTYRNEDKLVDSTESSELIRRTRRKRLVFDLLSVTVMIVLIPAISIEVRNLTNNSFLNFITIFIPVISVGFWALVFLVSDQWFKTRIVFSVEEGSTQNYWRYRYGLTRLFGARRVQQVLRRQKLPREFKYNFNVGESIYTQDVQYGKARSIDLEFNIEAQAIERTPNTIGEFIKGFMTTATKSASSKPARRISPSRMLFRIAFVAAMVYCGWLVLWGQLPWFTVLCLLGLTSVFQWSSLRNREAMKNGFLANHSKLKWAFVGILIFFTFSVSIGVSESIGLAGAVIDDLNPIPLILIGILGLWFYSEIYLQEAWFILPNGIYESMSCNFYRYEEILDSSKLTYGEFLQTQPVPSDASVVGFVWEHQNLDGGPDLRFKSNNQKANLQMAYVSLASETGLDLILQVSDWYKAAEFAGFWTFSEFGLTADNYLILMLFSCANTIDVISCTTGIDKGQFLALQRRDSSLDLMTVTIPENISGATLEIAAHMGLPKEQKGIVDSLISQMDGRMSYPDELSTDDSSIISPDIYEAPTLIFSDEKLELRQSSSPKNTLGDIHAKPNRRLGKLTWGAGSAALILATTAITFMSMGSDSFITESKDSDIPNAVFPAIDKIIPTAASIPQQPVKNDPPTTPANTFSDIDDAVVKITFSRSQQFGDASKVALGDVDNDGDLDVFLSGFYEYEGLNFEERSLHQVWLNDGNGSFTNSNQDFGLYESDRITGRVFLEDIDSDGDLDALEVVAKPQPLCRLWLNNGSGVFAEKAFGTNGAGQPVRYLLLNGIYSTNPYAVAFGDIDGNGTVDLLMGGTDSGKTFSRVYLNEGSQPFYSEKTSQELKHPPANPGNTNGVILGDFDGDGDLDAFTNGRNNDGVLMWINDGKGRMSPLTSYSSGLVVTPIQNRVWMYAGDFDGDDDLDVVASQHLWLNEGKDKIVSAVTQQKEHFDNLFRQAPKLVGFGLSGAEAFADFNEDGKLDVYTVATESESLITNQGLLDFKYNARTRLGDEESVGGESVASGDLDGDGDTDLVIVGVYKYGKVLMNDLK